ncbi:MAG: DUF560 domain-containing protein [Alphaproteobacteria bacterium]|nr:DUF560 domain-containing protein [Alphaproteobacteria bacterium]MDE2012017.1 DUF560 domain-containing protein [Alphaproteobacteria bacterium]MDE2073531.1 DUF560 domain-containing protein [Alphaproteobacteria bacterium]
MIQRIAALSLAAGLGILGWPPAQAADTNPWSLGLKAGVTYDDNVVLQQTDIKTGIGDTSADFELNAGYKLIDTKTDSLSIGYDFSQNLHAKLKNFDIQNHNISIVGSTQFEGATLGASYTFYHLFLAGGNFLDLHALNPSVLVSVTPQIFVRAAYLYMGTSFLTPATKDRSASHHQPETQLFYFFDNSRAYVLVGANYQIENANSAEFSYKGYALTASLQLPIDLPVAGSKLTVGYTYLSRNYDAITPSIGVKRYERRSTVTAGVTVPLVDKLSATLDYKYMDRSSNLLTTNYSENVIGAALHYDF